MSLRIERNQGAGIQGLNKMSLVLGYDFDKTHIKNSSYSPVAHGNMESGLRYDTPYRGS